jgi:hypothetical protein
VAPPLLSAVTNIGSAGSAVNGMLATPNLETTIVGGAPGPLSDPNNTAYSFPGLPSVNVVSVQLAAPRLHITPSRRGPDKCFSESNYNNAEFSH